MESEVVILKVFGYEEGSEDLLELEEVSFQCNITEVDKMIKFLQYVKEEHSKINPEFGLCHSHFRDWDDKWKANSVDIIVVTNANDEQ